MTTSRMNLTSATLHTLSAGSRKYGRPSRMPMRAMRPCKDCNCAATGLPLPWRPCPRTTSTRTACWRAEAAAGEPAFPGSAVCNCAAQQCTGRRPRCRYAANGTNTPLPKTSTFPVFLGLQRPLLPRKVSSVNILNSTAPPPRWPAKIAGMPSLDTFDAATLPAS